jgi:hypothetical protein
MLSDAQVAIQFSWTGTGTGNVTAGSATVGFRLPPATLIGEEVAYEIVDPTISSSREWGRAVWNGSALLRSSGTKIYPASAVNFGAGTKIVSIGAFPEEFVDGWGRLEDLAKDQNNTLDLGSGAGWSTLGGWTGTFTHTFTGTPRPRQAVAFINHSLHLQYLTGAPLQAYQSGVPLAVPEGWSAVLMTDADSMMRLVGLFQYRPRRDEMVGQGPPSSADNRSVGFGAGSRWWDDVANAFFTCQSADLVTATWLPEATGGGGGGGLPVGGTTGQRLTKQSNADFDVVWQTPGAPVGNAVPFGFVCPDDYGAVGDETTDDRAALAACFADAQATGSHVWLRPNAIYAMSNPQIILGGATAGTGWNDFIIQGNNATIKRHAGWTFTVPTSDTVSDILMIWRNCERFWVYDLIIDGGRLELTPQHEFDHNIQIRDACRDFVFTNCRFQNACGDSFYLAARGINATSPTDHPRRGRFFGCVFDNGFRNSFTCEYVHDMVWVGCTFSNANGTNPRAGCDIEPIRDEPSLYQADSSLIFDGCIFKDNQGFGLMMGAHSVQVTNDITVVNCIFDHNGTIEFSDTLRPNRGAMQLVGYDIKVQGCSFVNHTDGRGTHPYTKTVIQFKDASNSGTDPRVARGWIVQGCTFRNNTACGHCIASRHIVDGAWETSYPGIVQGNYFDIVGMQDSPGSSAGDEQAAAISWQYSDVVIRDNTIVGDGTQHGIRIRTTSGTDGARRNIVDSNRIENCAVGIVLPGVGNQQHSVWGNVLYNCAVGIQDDGGGAVRNANNLNV